MLHRQLCWLKDPQMSPHPKIVGGAVIHPKGLVSRILGLGLRAQGLSVKGLEFRVYGLGFGFGALGLGLWPSELRAI